SFSKLPTGLKEVVINRKLPGNSEVVKASSYEANELGNSTESALITIKNVERRLKTYADMKSYVKKHCEMIKIHGKKSSRNLVIGWGSTSGAIKDAIKGLNIKFLQVLYIKPLSDEI